MARPALSVLTLYLVLGPLGILVFSSFRNTSSALPFAAGSSFTTGNYVAIFASLATYRVIGTTLVYAVSTVLVAVALVVGMAFVLERTDFPFRRAAVTALVAPLGLPPFVIAMAWVLLANPSNGALNILLRNALHLSGQQGPLNVNTLVGMILVTAVVMVPSIYLMISGTFSRLDPGLEEASAASGVGQHRTLRLVSLPLLAPAILGSVVYFLVLGIELFDVPAFVGLPGHVNVLSTEIFSLANPSGSVPDYGPDSALGVATIGIALTLVLCYRGLTRRNTRYATVLGRAYKSRPFSLSKRSRLLVGLVLAIYCACGVVLPIGILLWQSLIPQFASFGLASLRHLSLENYGAVLSDPAIREGVLHTLIVAAVAAAGTMAVATGLAWLGLRRRSRLTAASEVAIFASLGIPSVVLALAVGLVYLWLPLGIYGTVWILVIAMIARFLSYGVMVIRPALVQVGRELEDASAASGAGEWCTLRRVVLPIVWPSLVRGFLWTFVQAARDVTIVLMLVTVSNVTIGSELWAVWFDNGNYSYGAAASVLLAALTGLLTYGVVRLDPMVAGRNK